MPRSSARACRRASRRSCPGRRTPRRGRRPALCLLLPTLVFHFPRMLAEGRRWAPYRRSFAVHEHGRAEHLEHSGGRALHLPQHVCAREVPVGERLGQGVHRTARNPGAPDPPDPLVRGPVEKLALERLRQLLPVRHPIGVRGVALVLRQVLATDGLAQPLVLDVVADGDRELLVRGVEGLVGDYRRVPVAHAALVLAGDEVLLAAVGEPGEGALEERHLDARAIAGGLTPAQRRQDRGRGVQAADDVRYGDPYLRGLAVRFGKSGYPHDARASLDQEIVTGTFLILPGPEAGDGAIDEAGIELLQGFVAETELFQGATPHVLDHDIRIRSERLDPLQTFRVLEVHAYGALVAVDGQKVCRLAPCEGRSPLAGVVAALGVLDLDHVCPEIREHHRRVRTGQDPREIEDLHAFEGQVHACVSGWLSIRKSRVGPGARLRPRCAPSPKVAGGSRNASPSEARRASRPSSNSYSISPSTT